MEEKILNIIADNVAMEYEEDVDNVASAAKEITNHVMEFIEWKDSFVRFDIEPGLYTVVVETHIIEVMSLEEVFEHWLTNIKK